MKIGILAALYDCAENLEKVLKPFQQPDFVISVCNFHFKEYQELGYGSNNFSTIDKLVEFHTQKEINYLCVGTGTEIQARNSALAPLIKENCDYIWLLDGDEFYTEKEVDNIKRFIHQRSETWYSIHFKNYVFDQNTWIDDFYPPRIFKTNYFNGTTLKINEFCEDNGVIYKDNYGQPINFRLLSSSKIPRYLAFIRHDSWISSEKTKQKVKYQEKRGWTCSYRWNEKLNKLEFNPEYYKDKILPELNYE